MPPADTPNTKAEVFKRKESPLLMQILLAGSAALILIGGGLWYFFHHSILTHGLNQSFATASSSDSYNCPPVTKVTLQDFSEQAITPSSIEPEDPLANDVKRSVLKDSTSLKIYQMQGGGTYAIDPVSIYRIGFLPGKEAPNDFYVNPVQGVDRSTFKVLSADFAEDKSHVYYDGIVLPGFHPSEIRIFPPYTDGSFFFTDANGNLALGSIQNYVPLDPYPLRITTRELQPIEAAFILDSFKRLKESGSISRGRVFSKQLSTPIPDNSEIRQISMVEPEVQSDSIPVVYGIFGPNQSTPLLCYAEDSGLVGNNPFLYKSHIIEQGLHEPGQFVPALLKVTDLSGGMSPTISTYSLSDDSTVIFDPAHKLLFEVLNTFPTATTTSETSIKSVSLDSLIAHEPTGKTLFSQSRELLRSVVISPHGDSAIVIQENPDQSSSLVRINLATGTSSQIKILQGSVSDTSPIDVPIFTSSDTKSLFYARIPYESFEGDSPRIYVHDFSKPISAMDSDSELTPFIDGQTVQSWDGDTLYALMTKVPQGSCNMMDYGTDDFADTVTSYSITSGTQKDIYTAEKGTVLLNLKVTSPTEISFEQHGTLATSTNPELGTSTPCTNLGTKVSIKRLSTF
jgi:hypothetical protein